MQFSKSEALPGLVAVTAPLLYLCFQHTVLPQQSQSAREQSIDEGEVIVII